MENPKIDIRQEVTNTVIELIEKGGLSFASEIVKSRPVNLCTGGLYSGVNILILSAHKAAEDFEHNCWMTFNQAKSLGASIKKGSHGVRCAKMLLVEDKTAKNKSTGEESVNNKFSVMKYFVLFNVEQIEGLPNEVMTRITPPTISDNEKIQAFDNLIANTGANIQYTGNGAFYSPKADQICVPDISRHPSTQSYYSTIGHELIHWTGHESRLSRNASTKYATQAYAFEELIAELGAAFLNSEFGLFEKSAQDNAAYIADWLTLLRNDKSAIFSAASKASKAADYLMAFSGSMMAAA